jgi:uncharacterized repeat protein (TIGR01451 family)
MGTGHANLAHAATTITVDCTADSGALAAALASASDGDTLAIQGTCNGTFEIAHNLTLQGSGGATLDAQGAGTVLIIDSGEAAVVSGITVTGGGVGGILNSGTLTLTDSMVTGNTVGASGAGAAVGNAPGATLALNHSGVTNNSGGGIINTEATLTITSSTVSGNIISGDEASNGGGIYNNSGTLTIDASTISDNTVHNGGAGILNVGTATIRGSTISGNTGTFGGGGGIQNASSTLTIENSTISGNTAEFGGAIEDIVGGTVDIRYSTIAGNTATAASSGGGIINLFGAVETVASTIIANNTGDNCVFVFPSGAGISDGGYNIDDGTTCGFSSANHSFPSTNPLLDAAGLAGNGGPTQTIALQPGSPAIDAIPPNVNGCGTTITTDQRGVSRPQGSGCDIGAFEFVPPSGADLAITKSGFPNPVLSGDRLTYTLTVTNNGPRDATGVTVTDMLPGSLHFNTVSSSQGTCTRSATTNPQPKGGTVTCTVGNLATGAKASITIVATATTPGTLTNTAKVNGNETDPDRSNNTATATTTVVGT